MMGIVLSETCWACNKICNKYHLLHLVGTLFPHNNDDARSKSLQIYIATNSSFLYGNWPILRLVIRHLETSQARRSRSQPSSSSPALSCWTFSPHPRHSPLLSLHHLCSCLSNMVAMSHRVALLLHPKLRQHSTQTCPTKARFEA